MNFKIKIIISVAAILLIMLICPLLAIKFAGENGMAICFILFFAVNPVTACALGILAGTDISRLWWIPILSAVLFAPLFWIAVGEIVLDLFIYAAGYLAFGGLAMLGTYIIKKTQV